MNMVARERKTHIRKSVRTEAAVAMLGWDLVQLFHMYTMSARLFFHDVLSTQNQPYTHLTKRIGENVGLEIGQFEYSSM